MDTPTPQRRLTGLEAHRFLRRKEVKGCIFCGRAPVTDEHVWSVWLRGHVARDKTRWETLKTIEYLDVINTGLLKRPGDPHDWQVRCVCGGCNNGWMSRLEKRSRAALTPLVDGIPTRLTKQDQFTVATWCALKTMVAEFDDPSRVTVNPMQRQLMYQKERPPRKGWRIWIGHFDRKEWPTRYINNTLSILPGSPPPNWADQCVKRYNTQSATQVIGKLFVHVVHSPYIELVNRWVFPPPAGGRLRQIWPLTEYSILWPPPALTDDMADLAARAFLEFCRQAVGQQKMRPIVSPVVNRK